MRVMGMDMKIVHHVEVEAIMIVSRVEALAEILGMESVAYVGVKVFKGVIHVMVEGSENVITVEVGE